MYHCLEIDQSVKAFRMLVEAEKSLKIVVDPHWPADARSMKERICEQIVEVARNGLVAGAGGNVSGRDPETGLIGIKPILAYPLLDGPDDMFGLSLEGERYGTQAAQP